jgi:folylpolyglutamate synthase/dihydropteroate synthase/DNA-directed RNA polymerase subunit RPC12/RpoP
MYAVVGCSECQNLWIVEGRPESSECPRCGHRRSFDKRRQFHSTEDADEAREARAALLANRQGYGDAFDQVDSFGDLEGAVEQSGIDDETYLEGSGLDAEEVAAAGERASECSDSKSREEIVREALRELETPGTTEVVAYAGEHGIDSDHVERALQKMVRAGEVSESRGVYRLV